MTPTLVVLTPVRNEAWALDRFLSVTSRVADLILVLDQGSTDGSRAIYPKYPKVVVLDNPSAEYDEAARQHRLLAEARQRVPGPRVLLALDADEVIAADGPSQPGWQAALSAPPGTVLCFEKPDLLSPPDTCIRYSEPWPLGFVDDGSPHSARTIHSIRLPVPSTAPRLRVGDVKILHYALTRPAAQRAKTRLYSVLEAVNRTSPAYRRRTFYAADRDWTAGHRVGPVDPAWFAGWETVGIDMRSAPEDEHHWQDYEVLRQFAKHGRRRFLFDDIWEFDWEACRQAGLRAGEVGLPTAPLRDPGVVPRLAGRLLVGAATTARRLLRRVRR